METNSTNNPSAEIMNPEEFILNNNENIQAYYLTAYKNCIESDSYESADEVTNRWVMTEYAKYYHTQMSHHSSSCSIWRRASEGFSVEGKPESLVGKHCRRVVDKKIILINSYAHYPKNSKPEDRDFFYDEHCGYIPDQIEWLDESASRPSVEDIKRWFQLLVGKDEQAMYEDVNRTFGFSRPEIKLPAINVLDKDHDCCQE